MLRMYQIKLIQMLLFKSLTVFLIFSIIILFTVVNSIVSASLFDEKLNRDGNRDRDSNDGNKHPRYLVLQIQTLGFANRVRVMADMNLAATLSDRLLLVSWEPTLDCNINITDIFEEIPDSIRVLPFILPHAKQGSDMVQQLAKEADLSFYDIEHEGFILPREKLFDEDIDVIYSHYNGVAAVQGIPCELYMYARSQFYTHLVPRKELLDMVKYVSNTFFSKHIMVGIHYRDFDPVFDWNVVPPTSKYY